MNLYTKTEPFLEIKVYMRKKGNFIDDLFNEINWIALENFNSLRNFVKKLKKRLYISGISVAATLK